MRKIFHKSFLAVRTLYLGIISLIYFSTDVSAMDKTMSASDPTIKGEQEPGDFLNNLKNELRLTDRDFDLLFSKNLNYLHEPYWSYNKIQLEGYGKRILEKIKPLIVEPQSVSCENKACFIHLEGKKIPVRHETAFGRVLPTLYLNEILRDNKTLGVPRFFLIPKNPNSPISFTFTLPYEGKSFRDTGHNPLQVLCQDFDIYKEYIEGNGYEGNTAFRPYGHMDFNAVQTIKSNDGKLYLIDTKEQKNFFLPIFLSYEEIMMHSLSFDFYAGSKGTFNTWQRKLINFMIAVKDRNLGEEAQAVNISIDCGLHCEKREIPLPPQDYKYIDFSKTNLLYQLCKAIQGGDTAKAEEILSQNSSLALEKIPHFKTLRFMTPIMAVIQEIQDSDQRLRMVELLVRHQADLEGALSGAIELNDIPLVEFFLKQGLNPTGRDVNRIIKGENLPLFKILFERRKENSIFAENLESAVTSLVDRQIIEILASVSGDKIIFEALLKLLRHQNESSKSEKEMVSVETKEEIGLLLLNYVKGKIDSSLLEYVLKNDYPKIRERLFEMDIPISPVFSYASYHNKPEFVDLLLTKKTLKEDEIDDGIVSALVNRRWNIIQKLLSLSPGQTPQSDAYLNKLPKIMLDMIVEHIITSKDNLLFDFLYPRLKSIDYGYFLRALESNNLYVIERFLDPMFLKRVGLVTDSELQQNGNKELRKLLHFALQRSFDFHNEGVIQLIEKKYQQYLGNMRWTTHLAFKSGSGRSILNLLKTEEDYADALVSAAEFGDIYLVEKFMEKLRDASNEPKTLDRALAATIWELDKSESHKGIKKVIWDRLSQWEKPILEETIIAAIESKSGGIELLQEILSQKPYDLNYVSAFYWITPLIAAIRSNNPDMVKFLLDKDADPNLPGISTTLGYPLAFAILQIVYYPPATVAGIRRYETAYTKEGKFKERDLNNIQDNNLKMIMPLMEHGAQVNLGDEDTDFVALAEKNKLNKIAEYLRSFSNNTKS